MPSWSRTCGPAVCVAALAVLVGCAADEPLLSEVSSGSDSSSELSEEGEAAASENPDELEAPAGTGGVAECVEGSWSIDKESYLQLVGSGLGALAQGLTVTGDATVTFSGNTVVSRYDGWTISGSNADGDITVVLEGTETAEWDIDENGMLSTTGVETTVESVFTVSAAGQQIVMPMASEDQPGLDLSGLATACESDTMTLTGPEGFLVMYRD